MERDTKGRFAPGNPYRFNNMTPEKHKAIARQGYQAFVEKYFKGDYKAAKAWFVEKGLFAQDQGMYIQVYRDPGPLSY